MLELIIIIAGIAIDQLVKSWAEGALVTVHGGQLALIPGVFNFTYAQNRGAAFGMLQGRQTVFLILTLVTLAAIGYMLVKKRKSMSIWLRIGLALIFSGAVGNMIDRVMLSYVRDMFDFCLINFAIFNVADACINVGAALMIICVLFIDGKEMDRREKEQKAAKALEQTEGGTLGNADDDANNDGADADDVNDTDDADDGDVDDNGGEGGEE